MLSLKTLFKRGLPCLEGLRLIFIGGLCCLWIIAPSAQANQAESSWPSSPKPSKRVQDPHLGAKANCQTRAKDKRESRGALVIAPLPISSPALGSGVIPILAYIFTLNPNDKTYPPSVIGAAGLVTDNGTRGLALGGELYLKRNYRIASVFLRGNLNYNLYGLGSGSSEAKLPLNQTGQLYVGEFLRRLGWDFFLGPRFVWGSSFITRRTSEGGTLPLPAEIGLRTSLTALGFRLNRDNRRNRFYPDSGTLVDLTADFFSQSLGSKYSFQSYKLTLNKYGTLSDRQIIAYNFFVCVTAGAPPFYGNCIYGMNNELRGYTAGRYLDRYMVATQLEYRLSLPKRLGMAAFGGLGEVVPGGNQAFRTANLLPSFGGGARFELSKKYHVNLRADIAQGRGSHTWTMGIGEAF